MSISGTRWRLEVDSQLPKLMTYLRNQKADVHPGAAKGREASIAHLAWRDSIGSLGSYPVVRLDPAETRFPTSVTEPRNVRSVLKAAVSPAPKFAL
jgi:hypothetical protein